MHHEHITRLGQIIREHRQRLGLSTRQLAERARLTQTTVVRLEHGSYGSPHPDKLKRMASALGLNLADVYALADYAVPRELPTFQPYLRAKYHDLPPEAVNDLTQAFDRVLREYGRPPAGPRPGNHEADT